jgi:SPP1 gp7 family putative phage head morphogenesis protein
MKKPKTLKTIRESAAIAAAYRKKLLAMLEELHNSILYWISANYRQQEGRIVGDASPSEALAAALRRLTRRWQTKLKHTPELMAKWFAEQNGAYTAVAVKGALKAAGITVPLRNTRAVNNIMRSIINQNVGLIKTIPQEYLARVEGIVQRGVMAGRDLGYVRKQLAKNFEVSERRAEMLARDQSNKAGQAMTKARYEDLGITRAIWQHNAGGKTFRNSHVEMNGEEFDLAQGMYDPEAGDYVQPGELINCRCSYRPVLPEFGGAGKERQAA